MIKEKLLRKEIYKEKQEKIVNIITRIFTIFIFCLLIVGCSRKTLNSDSFTNTMKDKKYSVVDISSSKDKEIIAVGNHYQVYFYEFTNSKKAKENVNNDIKKYNKKYINKSNNDKLIVYEISNNSIYTVYALYENTYINISVVDKYKNEVISLLKYLNYY